MINPTPIGGEESRRQAVGEEWRNYLKIDPRPPLGELREVEVRHEDFAGGGIVMPRAEMQQFVARESSRIMREQFEKSEDASKVSRLAAKRAKKARKRLEKLQRHRATLIEYARHRLEDGDWHGLSDAANDLRALDVEIRMTEAATK